jgi:hypothetical protein
MPGQLRVTPKGTELTMVDPLLSLSTRLQALEDSGCVETGFLETWRLATLFAHWNGVLPHDSLQRITSLRC